MKVNATGIHTTITVKKSTKNNLNFGDFLNNNEKTQATINEQKSNKAFNTLSTSSIFNPLYGYSVDNNGFMGADFNKAAGLPDDFKIHSSTLKEIERYNETMNVYSVMKRNLGSAKYKKTFDNIDMADTIKQYYKLFSTITHDNKDYPMGVSIDTGSTGFSFDYIGDVSKYKVTNIYKTNEELNYAKSIDAIGFNVFELSFVPKNVAEDDKEFSFSPDFSMYNEKERNFIGFLQSIEPHASKSGNTRLSQSALSYALMTKADHENIQAQMRSHNILLKTAEEIKNSGIDELLKTNNEVARFLEKTKV